MESQKKSMVPVTTNQVIDGQGVQKKSSTAAKSSKVP